MTLENKVAIVTGAAKGIGYAIAKRFVEAGAKVMLADIDEKAGEAVEAELSELGQVSYIHCNVAERLGVRNMVAATIDAFGDVDILVNNAGIAIAGDFLEIKEEEFDEVMSVNLKGPFLCTQVVARNMVERVNEGGAPGCIINISSINAVLGIENQLPYSVSKGGLSQLTRVSSLALAKYGIRVNAIGPGSIDTEMLASINDSSEKMNVVLSRTPLGRLGKAEEIAAVAAFLASDEASYITGQTIYADGGRLPLNYIVTSGDDN
ncbi:SDR family oxidoreductase [Rhodobacteraceae bacterium RKSG542]|uniref:SDR family NAD(P)-dependent oxidoreductase n=1 Tax=Pseudovibrio flavus TaxID=2529854 RepID=UPI0035271603|nr:SDR family oxidoreductase [Pseudovibrio flavus]